MTRREMLATAISVPVSLSLQSSRAAADAQGPSPSPSSAPAARANLPALKNMGGTPTAFSLRTRAQRDAYDAIEHCHSLGLGALEGRLSAYDMATAKAFRTKLEKYQMRAVLNAPLPKEAGDVAAFDSAVAACKEAGAFALHAAMTQRRYEEFDSFPAFKANFDRCQKSVQLAEPVLRKYKLPLAIENHKGWRAAEQAAWLKKVGSEYVGTCLDFGNNLSLCEDPMDTLKLLAPSTIFCHMKDMGVEMYDDGFLLSEVVFGQGVVDLAGIVKTLQQKDPSMIFALEMITRDPLKIPVFTEKYYSTFDDATSPLPGRDLGKTLSIVKKNPPKQPLPRTTGLTPEAQVKLEDDLNQRCVDYARQHMPTLA